jgi:hypothetical protein
MFILFIEPWRWVYHSSGIERVHVPSRGIAHGRFNWEPSIRKFAYKFPTCSGRGLSKGPASFSNALPIEKAESKKPSQELA